jgi:hypothetical protein
MVKKFDGKNLSFMLDGDQQFALDGTSVLLDSEDADGDAVVFAELEDGTPQTWFFQISAVADYGAASLHTFLWTNAGSEIPFVFNPYGGAVGTANPHWVGEVKIPKKPPVGGEAGSTWTFEARLDCVEPPERITA